VTWPIPLCPHDHGPGFCMVPGCANHPDAARPDVRIRPVCPHGRGPDLCGFAGCPNHPTDYVPEAARTGAPVGKFVVASAPPAELIERVWEEHKERSEAARADAPGGRFSTAATLETIRAWTRPTSCTCTWDEPTAVGDHANVVTRTRIDPNCRATHPFQPSAGVSSAGTAVANLDSISRPVLHALIAAGDRAAERETHYLGQLKAGSELLARVVELLPGRSPWPPVPSPIACGSSSVEPGQWGELARVGQETVFGMFDGGLDELQVAARAKLSPELVAKIHQAWLASPDGVHPPEPAVATSPEEAEVFALLEQGLSVPQVVVRLKLEPAHVERLYRTWMACAPWRGGNRPKE
jgi:hypothetical protein